MSMSIIIGIVFIVGAFIAFLVFTIRDGQVDFIQLPALVLFVVLGVLLTTCGVTFNVNTVKQTYEAAHRQDITITVSNWRQHPTATEPCTVKLHFDKKKQQLLIASNHKIATPEVLAAICK